MTWTALAYPRVDQPLNGTERATLDGLLGLVPGQLPVADEMESTAAQPGPPSARSEKTSSEEIAAWGLLQPESPRGKSGSRKSRQRPTRIMITDPPGCELRPDPREVQNSPELMGALRRYRIWAGEPSFREMATATGRRVAASTLCSALGCDAPRFCSSPAKWT
jgi:hypothetical protein